MKRIAAVLFCTLTLFSALSCNKSLETTYNKQESNIEDIVETLAGSSADAQTDYLDGVTRVTLVHGEGESLDKGGVVAFYYAAYQITGRSLSASNVFATNHEEFANSIKWAVTDPDAFEIATVNLAEESLVEGLQKGLPGVKAGDECWILFSGKHGFGKKSEGPLPSRAALAYHLWIRGVTN